MNTSSPEQPGSINGEQSNPEAEKPEILIPSGKIYEVLKGFEGEPLAKDATWSIGRRLNPVKFFSTEAKDGRYTTFTPGSEHPGMTWDKVVATTTNTLLTLSRRVLIGGETQATKSEGYKERQAKMRDRILEITALADANGPATEEEMARIYSLAKVEYKDFIGPGISGEIPDETEVYESLQRILKITTNLMTKNPSGEASV